MTKKMLMTYQNFGSKPIFATTYNPQDERWRLCMVRDGNSIVTYLRANVDADDGDDGGIRIVDANRVVAIHKIEHCQFV